VEKENTKRSKSVLKVCVIFLSITFVVFITSRYISEEGFRDAVDTYIFRKTVSNENVSVIEINSDTNPYIYAYDKYIVILNKNNLSAYTSSGNRAVEFDVNVSVPLMYSNGKYLVLAEKKGQKAYLISGTNMLWQKDIDGDISMISVNKNGYVSVVIRNTIYKSIIVLYNPEGNELFRTYISTDYVVCSEVSNNNKYLAIGETDYFGTIIKSRVKIFSIALAQTKPEDSVVYTYNGDIGEVITNIKYQDSENAICMFNTCIQKVTPSSDERLYDVTSNDIFVDIRLKDNIAIVNKQSSGLFSYEYDIKMKNINNKSDNIYILKNSVPKNIIICGNLIGLNFGNKVQIINSSGWLIKKYTALKEIQSLVLGESVAGVVYKNRVEIIGL